MSKCVKYTTGEMAKLCGVSVRTVQYYDKRGILMPDELSEGGRRIYSEDDLHKLRIICFLRSIGMSVGSIGKILQEEETKYIIALLLEQQEQLLIGEINERQEQLDTLRELYRSVKRDKDFSIKSIGDIAYQVKSKNELKKLRAKLLVVGIIIDIIEVTTVILWIVKGIWWPFVLGMGIAIPMGILISLYYMKRTAYICPKCHKVFQASKREVFFAAHTPRTRKLRCSDCGYKGYCVEVYANELE